MGAECSRKRTRTVLEKCCSLNTTYCVGLERTKVLFKHFSSLFLTLDELFVLRGQLAQSMVALGVGLQRGSEQIGVGESNDQTVARLQFLKGEKKNKNKK